ncbi:MAG: phage tail sheath subtilisin-like domain-containing protein [Planctomycetota bacterium]|nr:phage tail sheath subtilisin-like domain-containing protein [Planctomycetota bacterium]
MAEYRAPGMYVEEVGGGTPAIAGVPTSVAAFVGGFSRGPLGVPTHVLSPADVAQQFGDDLFESEGQLALRMFFACGGREGVVVRASGAFAPPRAATLRVAVPRMAGSGGGGPRWLTLRARSPGAWGNQLSAVVRTSRRGRSLPASTFDLVVTERGPGRSVRARETFASLTLGRGPGQVVPVMRVMGERSRLVEVVPGRASLRTSVGRASGGVDGEPPDGAGLRAALASLQHAAFNLLCVPGAALLDAGEARATWQAALDLCESKRAMLIMDPPASDPAGVVAWTRSMVRGRDAAVYVSRVRVVDGAGIGRTCGASGAIAGLIARTDATLGVWKAPAGIDATLHGVVGLEHELTRDDMARLNATGVNVLKLAPTGGVVAWGARTSFGEDDRADEFKYIPVRRLANYIFQSVEQGTRWVVFEQNDQTLWARVRTSVEQFLMTLWRQGALRGRTPREAFLVRCDHTTMTQEDIAAGRLIIEMGFAPRKPGDFVMVRVMQRMTRA